MQLSIYLDLVWLLNLGIDTLLLMLCGVLLRRRYKRWRLLLGGFIGSLIIVLIFTPLSSIALHPGVKLSFSIVMVLVAFGFNRFSFFLENLLTFYFSTFVTGGGLLAIHSLLNNEYLYLENASKTVGANFGDPVSWLFIIVGFPVLFYFSKTRMEDLKMKNVTFDQLVTISFSIHDQTVSLKGLIDSGNHLYDPISRTPVIVVTAEAIKAIIPGSVLEASQSAQILNFYENIEI